MDTFEDLADARRTWIDEVLRPWCERTVRRELLAAQQEWTNLAGKVDSEKTLWAWAWGRFPDLVHEEMSGIDETAKVKLRLKTGDEFVGFPDARESEGGLLLLLVDQGGGLEHLGPFNIDDIEEIRRVEPP